MGKIARHFDIKNRNPATLGIDYYAAAPIRQIMQNLESAENILDMV